MNALKEQNFLNTSYLVKRHISPIFQSYRFKPFRFSFFIAIKPQTVNSIFPVATKYCMPNYARAQKAKFSYPINKYKQ